MDSLLANYASSDDEEQEQVDHQQQSEKVTYTTPKTPSSSSIFSSLPPPKSYSSSSSISSLPSPKNSRGLNLSRILINPSSSKPNNLRKEEDGGDDDEDGDDGEEEEQQLAQRIKDSKLPSKFSGPVKPSLFSSLPEPKSSSSIFSALPPPKSHNADPFSLANLSSPPESNPKKVVQVRLPVNPSLMKSRDIGDDDEEDDDKERERKRSTKTLAETPSVKSFLSSIPAPKNSSTLGALPSAAGSGRRSIIEADASSLNSSSFSTETEVGVNPNVGNYDGQWIDGSSSASLGHVVAPAEYAVSGGGNDSSSWVSSGANYENYEGYMGHGNYGYYGQYDNNWGDVSTLTVPSGTLGTGENMVKMPGKRGRNEVPREIVEVKQDELIKNRPREDQTRLTGIAFGPSYQPASTKGKPSKLHKRKHQIGSLYHDMKQKEMELAERRAKGFLTKAETQAKYGW